MKSNQRALYISSSPRGSESASHSVAKAFTSEYLRKNPGHTVDQLDVWSMTLPEMGPAIMKTRYKILAGQPVMDAEQDAWASFVEMAKHFKSFDKFIFSVPMWNFSIPYKLKHYFDVIVQPSLTFSTNEQGEWVGLVCDKPAVVIYSRGNAYTEGSGFEELDFQRPYIELLLNFIGIEKVTTLLIEPTLENKKSLIVAESAAKRLAQYF